MSLIRVWKEVCITLEVTSTDTIAHGHTWIPRHILGHLSQARRKGYGGDKESSASQVYLLRQATVQVFWYFAFSISSRGDRSRNRGANCENRSPSMVQMKPCSPNFQERAPRRLFKSIGLCESSDQTPFAGGTPARHCTKYNLQRTEVPSEINLRHPS